MAETTVTLVSKDGEHTQKIEDTVVNRAEITRLRAAGWRTQAEAKAAKEPVGYDAQTVAALKDEIDARNTDREDDARLSTTGNKADLVAELEADDDA